MKPESVFRKRVDAFLNTLRPKVYHVSIQQKAIRGVPDKLLCVRGNFVAVEIKASGGKLSPLQAWNIQRIIDSDGIAILVEPNNFTEFKALITELANETNQSHSKQPKIPRSFKKTQGK